MPVPGHRLSVTFLLSRLTCRGCQYVLSPCQSLVIACLLLFCCRGSRVAVVNMFFHRASPWSLLVCYFSAVAAHVSQLSICSFTTWPTSELLPDTNNVRSIYGVCAFVHMSINLKKISINCIGRLTFQMVHIV